MRNLLICFLLFAANASFAQPSRFSYEQYIDNKDTLNYRMLIPDYNPSRKYPLVLFLHGAGERGADNDAQLKWGVTQFATDENMSRFPAIVIAPQCPAGAGWANVNRTDNGFSFKSEPSRSMEMVLALVDEVIGALPVDTSRIYITGLSMGGFGTFHAISLRPDLFAAALPVCGGGDLNDVGKYADLPIWVVAGAEDSVVSPQLSIDIVNELMRLGKSPGYTQYPEVGHFSWLMVYRDPLILSWLFRQQKE